MVAGLAVCVVVIIIMCGCKVCNSQLQLMTQEGGPDHIHMHYRKGLQQCDSREDHGEGVAA